MTQHVESSETQLSSSQRILQRAIDVIEASGEAAIRTNLIAFECGVTPPILYRAFGNREGLIIAAQAERYRRSSAEATEYLFSYISQSTSRESLRDNVSRSLDYIFSNNRSASRRLRAEVIGSSISRPALREAVHRIDREYSVQIAEAYRIAKENGWIPAEKDLVSVVNWAQGLINSRIVIDDQDDSSPAVKMWDQLSKDAILRAVFD